jgi:hypothetical protein
VGPSGAEAGEGLRNALRPALRRRAAHRGAPWSPLAPFGFSWRMVVWGRKASFLRVGKAWISLDSLVLIEPFQWVTRDFRSKNFSRPFALSGGKGEDGSQRSWCAEGPIAHGMSLTLVLIFRNKFAVELLPFGLSASRRGTISVRRWLA